MQRMSKYLDNSQMIKLKDTLDESLRQSEDEILEKKFNLYLDNDEVGIAAAKAHAAALRVEGYQTVIQTVPKERGKDVNDLLKSVLAEQETKDKADCKKM